VEVEGLEDDDEADEDAKFAGDRSINAFMIFEI